jgi:hypothetical protein
MTLEEFNEKYSAFLEEGHYGLDIGIPAVTRYLDEVFTGLIKIPGFQYSQIKSKFGSCRFYTNLHELLGNRVGSILSNEIEKRVTLLMEAHSDYLNYSEDRANPAL